MADISPMLHDADGWRNQRDTIVQAALMSLAMGGGQIDFLTVQFALAAAFKEAARQELARTGSSQAWFVLARTAERLSTP
jgi:hypothetical protein